VPLFVGATVKLSATVRIALPVMAVSLCVHLPSLVVAPALWAGTYSEQELGRGGVCVQGEGEADALTWTPRRH
jgi:hypothetical protein